MRWKLLRRRFSVYAPRVSVRRHMPWPLRWVLIALLFGFSAALSLWAFEFGRGLAGLDRGSKEELSKLRSENVQLRADRDKAQSIVDTAESLLKTEKATLERMVQQLKEADAANQELRSSLGFYERLMPAPGDGVAIRGLQVEVVSPGRISYRVLVTQTGKNKPEFKGKYDISLIGTMDGKAWTQQAVGGTKPLSVTQSARFEGLVEVPASAVVKTVQARILDNAGAIKSTQQAKF
jgi:hypothetical protein